MPSLFGGKREKGAPKHQTSRYIYGPWGKYYYEASSDSESYRKLYDELLKDRILPPESPIPSIKHHQHVTLAVMRCSRIGDRWVKDEPFADRLKRLREEAGLTQEKLAAESGLDVGTIRQLEQATRTNPQWGTVCSLASGLGVTVMAFLGTHVAAEAS